MLKYILWFLVENWQTFHKGPDSKYVRYCGPYELCQNHSTLHVSAKTSRETHKPGYLSLGAADILGQMFVSGSCPGHCSGFSSISGH